MTPVVQLHHATVVVAPRPGCQGPEHPHIQSLPMPLLTSAAGLGSRFDILPALKDGDSYCG
ncbi:hypothetical protein KAM347_31210 [Aeromonas caviae]|uniref:Uncharacterized protein n=1 Tax=Aeromonas caviae TaxID=648 RepID=A0AAV4YJR2_AERCA|nr:hypothetical protein KAM341_17240 [Aeromonas caviae]GJA36492.1 hypothetical protein KAM342_17350 [Aeromonas caviae]GJA41154.1 hypothetical protein KAM343_19500 [Aeromonas caviae]GJA51330.1 hypothetical protein KAM347_31210 [Aeromonas caviae]GJA59013.1 hypothetical protein KAM350_20060 [Aeromonas caviae]